MINPCVKNCPEKADGCRETCEKLAKYQQMLENRKKALARERLLDSFAAQSATRVKRAYEKGTKPYPD